MKSLRVLIVAALVAGGLGARHGAAMRAAAQSTASSQSHAPKLVVLLMVDQFRGDYVDRFQHQWTRGLHRLISDGAWFRQAEYPYYNTVTCAGHSSVATGTIPAIHGMILNTWWDRAARAKTECTDDPAVKTIGYSHPVTTPGESLHFLRVTTLADEMQAQLSPPARSIAFSLKARAAAPLGGHHPAAIAWFDDSGTWATSSAFSSQPVPAVAEFIKHNPVEADVSRVWTRALPIDAYQFEDPAIGVTKTKGNMTPSFPHALSASGHADAEFYLRWQSSPWSDEYLAKMTLETARQMNLGSRGQTDLIGISFSALDKVGHDFGPNSHEVQDVLIRLDRTLGDFFDGVDRLVGAGNYTVAVTGDHGVAPFPERIKQYGADTGRIDLLKIAEAIERVLTQSFGEGHYVSGIVHTDVYFEPAVYDRIRTQPAVLESVRKILTAFPGVLKVYTSEELARDAYDDQPMGQKLARSYVEGRSGDISFTLRPYWMSDATGVNHGSGYEYDTHVPLLLMGKGIVKGEYLTPAAPTDIAPTLAFLTNVTLPHRYGRVLTEALVPKF